MGPVNPNTRSGWCSDTYKWVGVNQGKLVEGTRQRRPCLSEESWKSMARNP